VTGKEREIGTVIDNSDLFMAGMSVMTASIRPIGTSMGGCNIIDLGTVLERQPYFGQDSELSRVTVCTKWCCSLENLFVVKVGATKMFSVISIAVIFCFGL
jgi:hypothetical protein